MGVVITREDIVAYAEVDYILKHMDERYVNKIPENLVTFFDEVKDPEHKIYVDPYKPLQSQGLTKYALEIIALLHLKYWCVDEQRKQELYNLMLENQHKLEEQIREKFNVENLFDNNQATIVKDASDLEEEDYSKPKVVQRYEQYTKDNPDIQDYSDLVEEENVEKEQNNHLPQKVANDVSKENGFFSRIVEKIKSLLIRKN